MEPEKQEKQLTLDVGDIELPTQSSFRLSGATVNMKELPVGADVRMTVMGEDGELVVEGYGYVEWVNFKEYRPKDGMPWVERQHGIKLIAGPPS